MKDYTMFGRLLMQILNKLWEVCESYMVNRPIEIELIRLKTTGIQFLPTQNEEMIQRNTHVDIFSENKDFNTNIEYRF